MKVPPTVVNKSERFVVRVYSDGTLAVYNERSNTPVVFVVSKKKKKTTKTNKKKK